MAKGCILNVNCQVELTVVVQLLSCVWLFVTQRSKACWAPPTSSVSWSLLKFMVTESVMLSNHLILCHALLLLPSIFPGIRVFPNESTLCILWLNYWSFSFSISPSNKYSGLISFRIDCFDLLAVQGNLEGLLQHQFWNINSLAFSLLYGLPLPSIHHYCILLLLL